MKEKKIHQNNKSTLASKTSWSAISTLSILVSSLLLSIVTARILGPNGFGYLAYLIWIIDTSTVFFSLGMQSTITRFLVELSGKEQSKKEKAIQAWILPKFLFLMILGLLFLITLGFLSEGIYKSIEIWYSLTLLFLFRGISSIYLASLAGRQRFDILAWVNIGSSLIQLICVIGLGYFFGLVGVLAGYILAAILPALLSVAMIYPLEKEHVLDDLFRNRILKFSLNTWFALIISTLVWSRIEILFIQKYWDNETIAMFSLSLSLAAIVVQGPLLLTGALMPHLAEQFGANNKVGIQLIYSSGTRLLGLALFPMCFVTAAAVEILIPLIYGENYYPAIQSAQILIIASALSFASIGTSVVMAMEKSYFIALSGFIGAIISIGGCFFLIPTFGTLGAAISRSIVQFSMIILGSWYIHSILKVTVPIKALLLTFTAALLSGLIVYVSLQYGGVSSMIFSIPLSLIFYLFLVRYFKIIDKEDEAFFNIALNHVPLSIKKIICNFLGLKMIK
jgi:O-antigen/teichoic acid export membrane protein